MKHISMQYKNIHGIEKNQKHSRVEKHTFSRTIQEQIKFKNIQGFQGPVTTLYMIWKGHKSQCLESLLITDNCYNPIERRVPSF